jgi:hypothetical protein
MPLLPSLHSGSIVVSPRLPHGVNGRFMATILRGPVPGFGRLQPTLSCPSRPAAFTGVPWHMFRYTELFAVRLSRSDLGHQ